MIIKIKTKNKIKQKVRLTEPYRLPGLRFQHCRPQMEYKIPLATPTHSIQPLLLGAGSALVPKAGLAWKRLARATRKRRRDARRSSEIIYPGYQATIRWSLVPYIQFFHVVTKSSTLIFLLILTTFKCVSRRYWSKDYIYYYFKVLKREFLFLISLNINNVITVNRYKYIIGFNGYLSIKIQCNVKDLS